MRVWNVAIGQCAQVLVGLDTIYAVAFSADCRWALSGQGGDLLTLWELDWEFEIRKPVDWDEEARCHLETFLTLHTPYAARLPREREPTKEEVSLALTRRGRPSWSEEDFQKLLQTLACAGYGWLRPEGVCCELDNMETAWEGPPPLPSGS
jgi:hypothetical protein